jgi:hypothetical protein
VPPELSKPAQTYLVQILLHKLLTLIWHPSVHKRRQIHVGITVQRELIMQELIRHLGVDTVHGELVAGEVFLDGIAGGVRDAM